MLTLPATALALIALVDSAVAAPLDSHPALQKRATGVRIVFNGLCLGAESHSNGAFVNTRDCAQFNENSNPPFYTKWDISPGNNDGIRLSGLPAGSGDFCLDSGDRAGSYPPAKLWRCYPGIAAQQFYYTDDKHIAITGGTECLETGRYGTNYNKCSSSSGSGIQSWDISDLVIADPTQVTSAPPTQTTLATPPPATQGMPITWRLNGQEKCLTVATGSLQNGAALSIADCFPSTSAYYYLQQFVYTQGRTKIRVAPNTSTKTDFCVDFGSDRGVNGVALKVWQCYDGLAAQQLWMTGDAHIAVEGDNQCADVKAESGPLQGISYQTLKDLQGWQCDGANANQNFEF